MNLRGLEDLDTGSAKVLLRIDVNSPIDPGTGRILDENRFENHRETFRELTDAAVAVLAHQSRPGRDDFSTTERHAEVLGRQIGRPVEYVGDYFGPEARRTVSEMDPGDVKFLENVRFYSEENLTDLPRERQVKSHPVRALSPLLDFYVNDAFACAHRNQISITGFPEALPSAAGRLMERELKALGRASPGPGTLFVLGGAKIEDSLEVARKVLEAGSRVAAGGLFGNLLVAAKGLDLGEKSEEVLRKNGMEGVIDRARELVEGFEGLLTPMDFAVEEGDERMEVALSELPVDEQVYDIGLETVSLYTEEVRESDAVIFNGPVGVFEEEGFGLGTEAIIRAMADSNAYTVVGGGHIVAALRRTGLGPSMSHVSTGGGALLSYLSGDPFPGLEALRVD